MPCLYKTCQWHKKSTANLLGSEPNGNANECKIFKVCLMCEKKNVTERQIRNIISSPLKLFDQNTYFKILQNEAFFSFEIPKDYIFNLGILKKNIIHLKLCLFVLRYFFSVQKKKKWLFTIHYWKPVEKIFGFRIIGGYMDKNSWIAESEALDELIAQKGCRTFQPKTFQPWTVPPQTF